MIISDDWTWAERAAIMGVLGRSLNTLAEEFAANPDKVNGYGEMTEVVDTIWKVYQSDASLLEVYRWWITHIMEEQLIREQNAKFRQLDGNGEAQ